MAEVISEKQKKLLSLAVLFDKICKREGINYSLCCGTALGAVREKGFIPWDDDFDIMMTLPEYKRINEICKNENTGFFWMCRETEADSPVIYARIYEKDVNLESLENFPYIDIHIYAGCPGVCGETKKEISKSDLFVKIYWFKKRKYHNIFRRKKSFLGSLVKIPLSVIPSKLCVLKVTGSAEKYPISESEYLMPVQGYYKMKEVIPKEYFDKFKYFDFNGYELPVTEEYDKYLTALYGDYMTPVKFKRI